MAREGFIEKTKCKEKNVQGGELSIHISEKITPEKGHSQYKHLKGGNSLVKVQYRGRSGWNTVCKGKCVRDNVRGDRAKNYCEVLFVSDIEKEMFHIMKMMFFSSKNYEMKFSNR